MKVIKISAMWCPSCIIMDKIFKDLKAKYTDIEFLEYDYDFDEEIVKKYSPGKILPVFIVMSDNKEERLVGEQTYEKLEELIKRYKDE